MGPGPSHILLVLFEVNIQNNFCQLVTVVVFSSVQR